MMRVLDLFSGIGGFSLGLERTGGFETVAFCEIEPFARGVLAKHWPEVPRYVDVRELTAARLRADGIDVDVICGGFPCQDVSVAGAGAGLAGARSGLWSEFARLIGEIRPRFVIVENVAALLGRGFGDVLGDLAALGYDAEWHCIPAAAIGAPHIRDRVWIIAYADGAGRQEQRRPVAMEAQQRAAKRSGVHVADADGPREPQREGSERAQWRRAGDGSHARHVADADGGKSRSGYRAEKIRGPENEAKQAGLGCGGAGALANTNSVAPFGPAIARQERSPWPAEPDFCRVVNGLPRRLGAERGALVGAFGNAVVPAIPEMIGHAILEYEAEAA